MTRKQREARLALNRAERLVLDCVGDEERQSAEQAFADLRLALIRAEPPPPVASGEWIVQLLETFDDGTIERTPRGKWICPLCGISYWGRESLARHMESPHGLCPEPGCGQVVTAAGLASHRYGRHEKPRASAA
jgi:hypothetical protein